MSNLITAKFTLGALFLLLSFGVSSFINCQSSAAQKGASSTSHLLSRSLETLADAATLRGMTSSQVIEYNPRNIAIMTVLNSMLILGGLLGTMNRNGVGGSFNPFKKRVDFGRFKKRWLPKKRNSPPTVVVPPLAAPGAPLHPHPLAHPLFPGGLPDFEQIPRPMKSFFETGPSEMHHPSMDAAFAAALANANNPHNNHNRPQPLSLISESMFDLQPRIPQPSSASSPVIRRRADLLRDDETSTESAETGIESAASSDGCGHVLRCIGRDGQPPKSGHRSASELSKSALRLLNSAIISRQLQGRYSSLLAKVRELIEIEERGHCFLHFTCQNTATSTTTTTPSPLPSRRH